MEKEIFNFIDEAKSILVSYFSLKTNKKIELKEVYPSIFNSIKNTDISSAEVNITDKISALYESSIPKDVRKDLGSFYTNDSKIIETMLEACTFDENFRILEPSCGSGFFLGEIAKKIMREFLNRGFSLSDSLNFVFDNLVGNDIDKIACEISEINVIASIIDFLIQACLEENYVRKERIKILNNDFTEKNYFKNYSLVIGNPPFVTMYGKRSRNMNEEKRAFFNTFDFVQNKKGNNKFNLSMFFIENGLKALRKNGALYFVLDISFFETAFIDMRKYLLSNFYIESIHVGLNEFDGVASGQILLKIINRCDVNHSVKWIDYSTGETTLIDQTLWLSDKPKFRISKPLSKIQESICKKIDSGLWLDFYYPEKCLRTCCALTGKTEEFIVNPKEEKEHLVLPYLEGSKGLSEKFGKLNNLIFIKYDYELQIKLSDEFKEELGALGIKNKKRVTLGDKDAYLAPKLFIRQSAFSLIATYTDRPFAANNSLYILTNKDYSEEGKNKLKYFCGLINSDLLTFYARIKRIIRADKGKTPQIKISDLKELKFIVDNDEFNNIVSLVDDLLLAPENNEKLIKLNDIVYKIYKIDDEEKSFIQNYLKKEED